MVSATGERVSSSAISQAVPCQICPSRSNPPSLQTAASQKPNITFGKLQPGKLHIWEENSWEIVTCEVTLGKMSLGKYQTPVKPILGIHFTHTNINNPMKKLKNEKDGIFQRNVLFSMEQDIYSLLRNYNTENV